MHSTNDNIKNYTSSSRGSNRGGKGGHNRGNNKLDSKVDINNSAATKLRNSTVINNLANIVDSNLKKPFINDNRNSLDVNNINNNSRFLNSHHQTKKIFNSKRVKIDVNSLPDLISSNQKMGDVSFNESISENLADNSIISEDNKNNLNEKEQNFFYVENFGLNKSENIIQQIENFESEKNIDDCNNVINNKKNDETNIYEDKEILFSNNKNNLYNKIKEVKLDGKFNINNIKKEKNHECKLYFSVLV